MSSIITQRSLSKVSLGVSLGVLLAISGFFVVPQSFVSPLLVSNALTISQQGITGNVTYGPYVNVCSGPGVVRSPPSSGLDQLIIRAAVGTVSIGLNYVYSSSCNLVASFRVVLAPGTYSVNDLQCTEPGAAIFGCQKLPVQVNVSPSQFTRVDIVIQTDIV